MMRLIVFRFSLLIASVLLSVACTTTNHLRPARQEPHEIDYLTCRDADGNQLGCSWYCGAPPIRVSATSTFRDGIFSYTASNIHEFTET